MRFITTYSTITQSDMAVLPSLGVLRFAVPGLDGVFPFRMQRSAIEKSYIYRDFSTSVEMEECIVSLREIKKLPPKIIVMVFSIFFHACKQGYVCLFGSRKLVINVIRNRHIP
jgi:hypothetical protein